MRFQRKTPLKRRKKRDYKKQKRSYISRVLLFVSLFLFSLGAFLLVRYAINTASAKKLQQETQEIYSETATPHTETVSLAQDTLTPAKISQTADLPSEEKPVDFHPNPINSPIPAMGIQFIELYKKNSDLIGWLKAEAIPQIDFPIVQRDNIHYLDRDFYGRKQQSGTVFLDESGSIMQRSKNLILHGHNMKNGTMFGKLYQCLVPGVIASNPLFEFSTLYESSAYVPYAVSIVSLDPQSDKYISLAHGDFSSETEMMSYVDKLREFSKLELPVNVTPEDKLLTLITCHGDEEHERLVVALRQVRSDEDADMIKQKFSKMKN